MNEVLPYFVLGCAPSSVVADIRIYHLFSFDRLAALQVGNYYQQNEMGGTRLLLSLISTTVTYPPLPSPGVAPPIG